MLLNHEFIRFCEHVDFEGVVICDEFSCSVVVEVGVIGVFEVGVVHYVLNDGGLFEDDWFIVFFGLGELDFWMFLYAKYGGFGWIYVCEY